MGRVNPSEKGILRVIAYCYGEKLHTPSFLRKILTHVMTHVTKRTDEHGLGELYSPGPKTYR